MIKGKIVNDPVYGFLKFPEPEVMMVINHPWFQRLRRIKQMGLSSLVYPGAEHTRFHHSLGACHLMGRALDELLTKGFSITKEEKLAARLAILMHDIGHGPFSHSLEYYFISDVSHEEISNHLIKRLIEELDLPPSTQDVFLGTSARPFLHQLVSSQLDVDRMDYLNRDSFYSGVSEGVIGYDRILQMLSLHDDQLVVEEKGIHSVEKFIIARRLMYWQVYLHKTVLGAEQLLVKIMQRAQLLSRAGELTTPSVPLHFFMSRTISRDEFLLDSTVLQLFCKLDDTDILGAIKSWVSHPDKILSFLCTMLLNRNLFKVYFGEDAYLRLEEQQEATKKKYGWSEEEIDWFVFQGNSSNHTYDTAKGSIIFEMKDGGLIDLRNMNNSLINEHLNSLIHKKYLCYLS